jgi:hypothetical protein
MMKEFENDEKRVDHPEKEVVFLYTNENADEKRLNNKFIVETKRERPAWFNNNLYTKVLTKK